MPRYSYNIIDVGLSWVKVFTWISILAVPLTFQPDPPGGFYCGFHLECHLGIWPATRKSMMWTELELINWVRPEQNGWHFVYNIFTEIFRKWEVLNSEQIVIVLSGFIAVKSILVHVITWCYHQTYLSEHKGEDGMRSTAHIIHVGSCCGPTKYKKPHHDVELKAD